MKNLLRDKNKITPNFKDQKCNLVLDTLSQIEGKKSHHYNVKQ
jgi:hypothetical protein